jgi:hypothetical protein
MRLLLVLTALLVPVAASAQFGISSIDDPIRPARAPLAHAEEVSDVLLLGLGGPTAALVNPARAARLRHRFAYGTIRPQEDRAEPVSFTGLVGTRDRRWLIVADNAIFTRNTDAVISETRTMPDPGGTVTSEFERVNETSSTASLTRVRLLHVGRTDFGGFAVGLYGGYRGGDSNLSQTTSALDEDPVPPNTSERRQRSENLQQLRSDDFAVGVEAAFAGDTWDLAAAASYQRRTADATLSMSSFLQQDVVNPAQTFFERREESTVQAIEGSPEAVDVEVIGALRAGQRRDDYLFGAVRGTFGGGTADYRSAFDSERLLVVSVDGEVVEQNETSDSRDDAGAVDLETRDVRVSLGYVYAQRGRSLTVLAALNPMAAFGRVDRAAAEGPFFSVLEERDERTEIALQLPLYVRFDVTKRLETFGGGVFTYAYERLEMTQRPRFSGDLTGQTEIELTREQIVDTFSSDGRLYAGALFTVRSGLTAQAAVRGDLAAIDGWTVSLGYRF